MLAENEHSVVRTLIFGRAVFTDFNATINFILTTELHVIFFISAYLFHIFHFRTFIIVIP